MEDLINRFWGDLISRFDGPMKFRIIIQPLVSLYFAYKAGKRDSKTGQVPYFAALITGKAARKELVKQGWKDIRNVFIMAIIMDVVYQLIMIYSTGEQSAYYPMETVITAIFLTFVPYLLFRGPVNRLLSRTTKKLPK